ncbi:hypothetical protein A3D05_00600 [Candidatus Gottesmanbacteria bacterium RIFCSPHIGHO2_02_FULL_40_24]|uniref:Regulatory protein RecX n=1 Tax=Candidatus Gottesmanbacteria bacterium RIFCSPHIGHO2_01_FULL_40_15 TaxID=1798376 RepID=A0A1F5Z6K7_9BACT|nr:MAG: hypothetical protein A2777_01390 [Candidatus Gottesmanbacteria bacterium RIFCSPHIGHO2_01_FULL_40_15]OGG18243.1 MAG: hypothetical protein A3D05_00600 [Candidatus Gottesmanbacteria bacterium RIFCSPHIGHO2_02_FULL_40_24]OGG22909.1 MAG: hypothetical protein A3B48_01165 [Candidatus Gottesmanbacteria bacterium RIFCSPLOWO2_01_FULL_40_10]OGG23527.1 MAG: hypothetical protein A3E42_00680 [Candidatus Gottesmanbacteria bacterium RIFCSPHIGHO2_12_FULL_40_13]OGG32473.1 MAG: hypothetical protein A3I80_0
MDDDELQKVKNYALKLLSFRPRSSFELKKKLDFYILKKKLPPNLTSVVLKDLKKINLVNDKEFAEWWIEQRTVYSIRGEKIIRYELQIKGIGRDLIDDLLSSQEKGTEITKAEKIIDKQMKKLSLETDRRLFIEKLKMHLLRRGFSWSVTHKVIDSKMGKS